MVLDIRDDQLFSGGFGGQVFFVEKIIHHKYTSLIHIINTLHMCMSSIHSNKLVFVVQKHIWKIDLLLSKNNKYKSYSMYAFSNICGETNVWRIW